jgi:hypothetical protein
MAVLLGFYPLSRFPQREGRAFKNSPVGYFSDGASLQGSTSPVGEGLEGGQTISTKGRKLRPFVVCSRPVSRILFRFSHLRKIFEPASIIYLVLQSLAGSYDLPPGIGRAVLTAGIHGLSTHQVYGSWCCHQDR